MQYDKDVAEGKTPSKPEPAEGPEDDFAPPVKTPRGPSKPRAPRGSKQDMFYEAYKKDKDSEKVAQTKASREARMRERDTKKWGWQELPAGGAAAGKAGADNKEEVVGTEPGESS